MCGGKSSLLEKCNYHLFFLLGPWSLAKTLKYQVSGAVGLKEKYSLSTSMQMAWLLGCSTWKGQERAGTVLFISAEARKQKFT